MTPENAKATLREDVKRACTCKGDFWPDSGERIVTVGCPVHHLMEDGAPAAEHEISCMCGNFEDDRKCRVYLDTDDGEEVPVYVCPPCFSWAEQQSTLTLDPAPTPQTKERDDRTRA